MVTIIDFKTRENSEGIEFGVLILQGDIETVRSKTTNRPYITARKSSIPTTLDETFAKNLIGKELPGSIERIECEAYEFVNPETGKKVKLDYTYQYNEAPATVTEEVVG
ncbi:MAG: hypothetical protein KAS71_08605 [Bacteroidales bacterium]|nr:hypothetical protein [Bacteroidales bacterium]